MKKLFLVLLLCIVACTAGEYDPLYLPIEIEYTGYELEVLHELNIVRVENHVGILVPEAQLTIGAIESAEHMDSVQVATHYGFGDRYIASHAIGFGEIIASNYLTPASEISAFEHSNSHRPIMLNPIYTHCGIHKEGNYLTIDLASYKN